MEYLNTVDYGIIIAYFISLIVLGIYLHRLASKSMESYFLAGRSLPWWALGISGMGYSLDIAGTMLIISLLYLMGPKGLFVEFRGGVSLALICQMIWTGKWHRRSGCMTVAEWMTFRFGTGKSANFARIATALSFIVFTISMLTYMVVGVGLFLSLFIPLTPLQCALIMIGIATIYTAISGLYGVVISDLLQCGLIILGVLIIIFLAVGQVQSGSALSALSESITGFKNWTSSFPAWHTAMPKGYEQYENLIVYAFFFLVLNKMIIGGFGTGHEPQFFAAKNERECGKLSCLWATLMTFRWPMMIAYAVIGLYMIKDFFPDQSVIAAAAELIKQNVNAQEHQWREILAQIKNNPADFPAQMTAGLQQLLGTSWTQKLDLISFAGTVNAERILPSVLLYKVPAGFRGLILVTLIAASMSTFDMTMNKSAAMFTNDIYRRYLKPNATNRQLMSVTYAFCFITVAIAFLLAYNIKNINDIWGWITMGLWSGIGMPMLLRLYWWRYNGTGFATGMFGGLIAALAVLFVHTFFYEMSEVTQFCILTPVSLACAVAGTYMSKPTDSDTLNNFYTKTRPFGFWGPLKDTLPAPVRKAAAAEHRNDLLALPCAFVWMVTMYLAPMQLITKQFKSFWITFIIFIISLVGLYKFWYKNLPTDNNTTP